MLTRKEFPKYIVMSQGYDGTAGYWWDFADFATRGLAEEKAFELSRGGNHCVYLLAVGDVFEIVRENSCRIRKVKEKENA